MAKQLWLSRTWRPTITMRGLIQTHKSWMTVAAAAIVFATFVIKDAYQESLRDITAELSAAQSAHSTRSRIAEVKSEVDLAVDNIQFISKEVQEIHEKAINKVEPVLPGYPSDRELVGRRIDEINERIATLKPLLKSIGSKDDGEKMKILSGRADEVTAAARRGFDTDDDDEKTWGALLSRSSGVRLDLVEFDKKVLEDAEAELRVREKKARIARITSYILYPFGIVFALVSKLYGADPVED